MTGAETNVLIMLLMIGVAVIVGGLLYIRYGEK